MIIDAQRFTAGPGRGFYWKWHEEAAEVLLEREQGCLRQEASPVELSSVLQRLWKLSRLLEMQAVTSRLEQVLLH